MSTIFHPGGALPVRHRTYVRRHADEEALETMLDGEYLHLVAPRQVGKTSLLKHLMIELRSRGWRCAYVDLSVLMDFGKAEWYHELGRVLGQALTPDDPPTLTNQIDLRNYLLDRALGWHDAMPRIALLFDEVEGATKAKDNADLSFSDTFFMVLRNIYIQRDESEGVISVAFAGATDPSELVKDISISPFNIGTEVALDDFTWPESLALTKHLELARVSGTESLHQSIHAWADGHPYLMQRICFALEREATNKEGFVATASHVEQIVEQTILNRAKPLQRDNNLKHIVKMLNHLSPMASVAWSRLQTGQVLDQEDVSDELYRELYLTGAVKMRRDQHIGMRNPIYEKAFSKKLSLDHAVAPVVHTPTPGKQFCIFISSTWHDLQNEREAVERALHRVQDTSFASMQYFGSRPDMPEQVSLAELSRSNIYIGIFAHRYGSGITEAEYRYARERNIPCLIYFKDESVPVLPAYVERDPKLAARLEALKRELQLQHILSPFTTPDHLATQVVADLHNLLAHLAQNSFVEEDMHDGMSSNTVTGPLQEWQG